MDSCSSLWVCYAGGLLLPSHPSVSFTLNWIFWADTVNLKSCNMFDSDSEESRVHFWKWLYVNKSSCRALKQDICWLIGVVPLFPCHLQYEVWNVSQDPFLVVLNNMHMPVYLSLPTIIRWGQGGNLNTIYWIKAKNRPFQTIQGKPISNNNIWSVSYMFLISDFCLHPSFT